MDEKEKKAVRLTGSKEACKLLHHAGIGKQCRELNNVWAKSVKINHKHVLPPGFIKGRTIQQNWLICALAT